MTRFWWVRHGPTHQTAFTGWRNVPADLSDTAALARLDAYLPQGAVLVASDLSRASTTADCLNQGRERLPDSVALREFHLGDWDGKHFEEVAEAHPELSRAYWEAPGDIAPPGGESWNMGAARIAAKIAVLIQAHRGRDIIIVAHSGVILTQVQRALNVTPYMALSHRIDNLSVTMLSVDEEDTWRAEIINHLP